jgi:octaprenyl-diphosphate synthase
LANIDHIKALIAPDIKKFEVTFKQAMKSNTPMLDRVAHYIIKRKGKQIRPMFVFLSAKTHGETSEATYTAATLIELLHTATLVHDDVVDDSHLRRGFFSLNAIWKNKIAVLVGDYLLAKGLLLSIDNNEFDLLHIVSTAVKQMSEGELLQMEKARRLNITEEIYYEIIRQKTASLLASCCAAGTASVGAGKEKTWLMHAFGEHVGMAFQIKDDLFDYGSGKKIGKPTGIDIRERKMTLPLIYTLNNCDTSTRRKIINTVKNHNEDTKKVNEVIQVVLDGKGIDYATEKMISYRDKALNILHSFPENEARKAMEDLVHYTIEREK